MKATILIDAPLSLSREDSQVAKPASKKSTGIPKDVTKSTTAYKIPGLEDKITSKVPGSTKCSTDPLAMVEWVLRESYRQTVEDTRYYAEKLRFHNETKKAIRDYAIALRDFKGTVLSEAHKKRVDLCNGGEKASAVLADLIDKHAMDYEVSDIAYALCIPDRVPSAKVKSIALLDCEIVRWEESLNAVREDSQLGQIDLQNALQKTQQILQELSNLSKTTHDTAMSIIRNMRG
jgi:hypothetical protein